MDYHRGATAQVLLISFVNRLG
jgi:hypothetical protein